MQRTRSSPSAPRSPLMRCPLGGSWRKWVSLVIVGGLSVVAGCESYHGRLYWAWAVPALPVELGCQDAKAGQRPVVRIKVGDKDSAPLPGVKVTLKDVASSHIVSGSTNPDGCLDLWLNAGRWQVDLSLQGWPSQRYIFDLPTDHACTLTFRLEYRGET